MSTTPKNYLDYGPPWLTPLIITVVGVLFSVALDYIPLPLKWFGVDVASTQYLPIIDLYHFGSLGFGSLISAFFLIEVLSFFLPPLRNWRRSGIEGRKKLNIAAFSLTVPIAIFSCYQLIRTISGSVESQTHLAFGPLLFIAILLLFGLVLRVLILLCISRWGIGNGWSMIILGSLLVSLSRNSIDFIINFKNRLFTILQFENRVLEFIVIVASIILLVYIIRLLFKTKSFPISSNSTDLNLNLPILPQSLAVWQVAATLFLLPNTFQSFGIHFLPQPVYEYLFKSPGAYHTYQYAILALSFPLSYLGYSLFSRGTRIQNLLENRVQFDPKALSRSLMQLTLRNTLLMTVGGLLVFNPLSKEIELALVIRITTLVILISIVKDIIEEFRFLRYQGKGTPLFCFDNVYFASLAKEILKQHQIPFRMKGFYHRQLFFWTAPLIKMELFVREEDSENARKILDCEGLRTI